jgi:hypothetical protein
MACSRFVCPRDASCRVADAWRFVLLVQTVLCFLNTRDLSACVGVNTRLNFVAESMVNTLKVRDLSQLIARAVAPTPKDEAVPLHVLACRRVVANELVENHKLGFQATSGRALWPHFISLIREVRWRAISAVCLRTAIDTDRFCR